MTSSAFIYVSMLGRSGKELDSNSQGYRFDSLPLQIRQMRVNTYVWKLLCYLSIYGRPVQNLFQWNQTTLAEWSNDCPVSKDVATSKPLDVSKCCGHRFPYVASLETLCLFLKTFSTFLFNYWICNISRTTNVKRVFNEEVKEFIIA